MTGRSVPKRIENICLCKSWCGNTDRGVIHSSQRVGTAERGGLCLSNLIRLYQNKRRTGGEAQWSTCLEGVRS